MATVAAEHLTTAPRGLVANRIPTAAERLDVSEQTIRRMIASGKLRAVRVGRLWLIPEDALQEVLQG